MNVYILKAFDISLKIVANIKRITRDIWKKDRKLYVRIKIRVDFYIEI